MTEGVAHAPGARQARREEAPGRAPTTGGSPPALSVPDLRAAVSAGIVTEAQAAALLSLAHVRRGDRERAAPGDEPFELFRGFNEIFVVVGLLILASGWATVLALVSAATLSEVGTGVPAARFLATAALIWALSEYFVRRRRMVAPAITLSILWGLNALLAFGVAFANPIGVLEGDYDRLAQGALLATGVMALHWARFRVPFAMALIALGLFGATLLWLATSAGTPTAIAELFLLSAEGPFALATLALGLAFFAAAMAFDMSDPHRVTRRASNGFWLHVVAAPAIANTVALTLLERGDAVAHAALLAFLAAISVVAIVIDRRSFLIAAVGYTVTLAAAIFGSDGFGAIILGLGATLLVLGASWERMRGTLLRAMPSFVPTRRLPPAI